MRSHEWENLGLVSPGAPARGWRWRCYRCGMRVRSNREPFVPFPAATMVWVETPGGTFPAGSVDRYPADCDSHVVRIVMRR